MELILLLGAAFGVGLVLDVFNSTDNTTEDAPIDDTSPPTELTDQNDRLDDQTNDDLLVYGLDGDDVILEGSGNSTLFGGEGSDYLRSRGGQDIVFGGNDADRIVIYIILAFATGKTKSQSTAAREATRVQLVLAMTKCMAAAETIGSMTLRFTAPKSSSGSRMMTPFMVDQGTIISRPAWGPTSFMAARATIRLSQRRLCERTSAIMTLPRLIPCMAATATTESLPSTDRPFSGAKAKTQSPHSSERVPLTCSSLWSSLTSTRTKT